MLLCGGADGVFGGEVQTHGNDYPLQGYLEAFVFSFVPKKGVEEEEMSRLECLVAELMRCNLMSHDAWLHAMIANGAFLPAPAKVFINVCVCVCVCLCMHACMCVCVCVCVRVSVSLSLSLSLSLCNGQV
jgi:hypothetical protein